MRTLVRLTVVVCLALAASTHAVWAQTGRSVDAAAALVSLMEPRRLATFAAADPAEPGRFVAAMYFPGTQLLVVSARYPVPVLLEQRLHEGQFQQAYMDLQCGRGTEGQWFVQDLKANGLLATREPGEPFDLVDRGGTAYVALDGDWARQGLTADEYRYRYATADEAYTRMLTVLARALRPET